MYQYIQRPKHERVFARYSPQRSCDKVIFSQASVILSTEGEVSAPAHAGIHTPPLGRHTPGQTSPPPVATAADGTHPTGMHSCYKLRLV